MTNEEAIEKLKELKTVAPNENYGAFQLAIKALKNQTKYERALDMAVECITDCDQCPTYVPCGLNDNGNGGSCSVMIKQALKREAGIEDDAK